MAEFARLYCFKFLHEEERELAESKKGTGIGGLRTEDVRKSFQREGKGMD